MKNPSIFFALALTLILAATLRAQSPLLTSPVNLAQFPSVERIKAGTKGADEVDSHARFMTALDLINGMIVRDLIQAPNGGYFNIPPAAARVQSQYSNALTRFRIDEQPPASRDPRFRPLVSKYEKDPVFFDGLLTQFFSPKFRTDYYAWIRKPVPQQTAVLVGTGLKTPTADPSIAKAKAFKMDTSVFGLELGQPVSLPTCSGGLFATDPRSCVVDDTAGLGAGLLDFLEAMIPPSSQPKGDPNVIAMAIHLDEDHCPSWISGDCNAQIILQEGVLVAVSVSTKGRKVENSVNAELKAKYGPPNLVSLGKITPDVGNPFEVRDPIWMGRGIRVEYQVVIHNEEQGVNTSQGWVRVMTETAFDRLFNKPVKKKM